MKNFLTFILMIIILFGLALLYRPTSDSSSFGVFIENTRIRLHIPIPTVDEEIPTKDQATTPSDKMVEQTWSVQPEEAATVTNEGYVEFSDAAVKQALTEGKQVVLFFRTNWCSTCNEIESNINSEAITFPDNVVILKIDYDTATDLKVRYKVTDEGTLVYVDENMEEIHRQQGTTTVDDLLAGFSN